MVADGEVHSIDVHSAPQNLYVVEALKLLRNKTPEDLQDVNLPPSRDLAFLAEPNSDLMKILDDIEINPANWRYLLPEQAISQIPNLRNLLERAKQNQENIEKQTIRERAISPAKEEEFYKNFEKGYQSHATLSCLAQKFGILEDNSDSEDLQPELSWIGYNQIEDKEAFFEDWYVHYSGWGEQHGEGVANGESSIVFEQIAKALSNNSDILKNTLVSTIREKLQGENPANFVAIGFRDFDISEILRESELFIPNWRMKRGEETSGFEDVPFYLGYVKLEGGKLPLFRINTREPELLNSVAIIPLKEIGHWEQLPPINRIGDKVYKRGKFMLKITDLNYNNEFRDKILGQNPDWLRAKEKPEDYLREKVVVEIYEKFTFTMVDPDKGFRLNIVDPPVIT